MVYPLGLLQLGLATAVLVVKLGLATAQLSFSDRPGFVNSSGIPHQV